MKIKLIYYSLFLLFMKNFHDSFCTFCSICQASSSNLRWAFSKALNLACSSAISLASDSSCLLFKIAFLSFVNSISYICVNDREKFIVFCFSTKLTFCSNTLCLFSFNLCLIINFSSLTCLIREIISCFRFSLSICSRILCLKEKLKLYLDILLKD